MTEIPVGLSIRQPWAFLIAAGIKDVENRTWWTRYRGLFYIHAGLTRGRRVPALPGVGESWILERLTAEEETLYNISPKHRGAIIGSAELVDCVDRSESRWFVGPWGLVVANAVLFENPISCKGHLGFFNVDMSSGGKVLTVGRVGE